MSEWITPGYEHLELSTQRVIGAALQRGIEVEILDEKTQWVRFSKDGRSEIVRQGNETSKDSYITSLILGDKGIQKQLLDEAGIRVPTGYKYDEQQQALDDFDKHRSGRWVIKPTTANYGLGISILPENVSESDFIKAINLAFEHDETILTETFLPGIECRFLVIGGVCRAVLHRVPANVIGDGTASIRDLVAQKNADPRRGKDYKTPLEKIELGATELGVLAAQDLTFESVPKTGQQVWLRNNSNISTGGDSVDYTDTVHPDYKAIAEKAANTLGAKVCGVDMMMAAFDQAPDSDNYGIIEANYNPVLYFHNFPYEGQNRDVAPYILDLLGFAK